MKNMFFFFLCLLHNNYLYYSFLIKQLMEKVKNISYSQKYKIIKNRRRNFKALENENILFKTYL